MEVAKLEGQEITRAKKLNPTNKTFFQNLLIIWSCGAVIFFHKLMLRIRDVYPGSNFFPFRITDPRLRKSWIPYPDPHKKFQLFLTQKLKRVLSIHPGYRILALGFFHPGSRVQGSKSTGFQIRNIGFL
jgi:hypothetical protein